MKKAFVILILILTLLLSACGNQKSIDETIEIDETVFAENSEGSVVDITVFYKDSFGYIVPVETSVQWTEGIGKAVIRKMMNTKELQQELVVMGLESLMPPEAALNGLSISNGLAKIDFNTAKLTFNSKADEESFVNGVVLALTSFPTVKKVQFLFNGYVIDKLPFGTKVSEPLEARDINPASVQSGDAAVSVFYHSTSSTNYEYYVPITAYVKENTVSEALNYLFSVSQEGLETGIPEGTVLTGAGEIGDYYCIYVSEEFRSIEDSPEKIQPAIKSIVLTAAQFTSKQIKIYSGNSEFMPDGGFETQTVMNVF